MSFFYSNIWLHIIMYFWCFRLYGIKCAKCNIGFSKNDFVMRARSKVYHIECFRCVACSRQLIPGDEFALREDGLFCRADHDVVERATRVWWPVKPLHPARPLQMAGRHSILPQFTKRCLLKDSGIICLGGFQKTQSSSKHFFFVQDKTRALWWQHTTRLRRMMNTCCVITRREWCY